MERPGRVRSRHARERAKNYVLHIQTRFFATVCNKPIKNMDCYPLQANREHCILEDQCCRSCAKLVREIIRVKLGGTVVNWASRKRAEKAEQRKAYALSVRSRIIDAVLETQKLNDFKPVRTDEAISIFGEKITPTAKMMWSRVFVRVAASGVDDGGRRLVFAGRVARGFTWTVAVTGSEPVESEDV